MSFLQTKYITHAIINQSMLKRHAHTYAIDAIISLLIRLKFEFLFRD